MYFQFFRDKFGRKKVVSSKYHSFYLPYLKLPTLVHVYMQSDSHFLFFPLGLHGIVSMRPWLFLETIYGPVRSDSCWAMRSCDPSGRKAMNTLAAHAYIRGSACR